MTEPTAHLVTARPAPSRGLAFASLLRADATVMLRTRQTLILNLFVPVLYIVILGINQAKRHFADPGSLIGLALTVGLMSAGMLGYSLLIAADREAGVFQRLRVTPTPSWLIMGSRICVQLAASLVVSIITIVLGQIVFGVGFSPAEWLGMLGVSVLGAIMFLCIGQAIVALCKAQGTVNAVGRVLFIVLLLVGLLGTSGILGDTLQAFAKWTPVGALSGCFTAISAGWTSDSPSAVIATTAYAVVCGAVGIRWFRWDPR